MAASLHSEQNPRRLVLLVEDEALVRVTLTTMLESGGFRVIPCAHADEALEVLAAFPDIRAVVTDVKLSSNGMNGFELARTISERWHLGVVVASGRVMPEHLDLPASVNFIAKPVHGATLTHLVRSAIDVWQEPTPAAAPRAPAPGVAAADLEASRVLTPRQDEVLSLLVQGKPNREIARELDMAENTVKVHIAAIFRALGVSSRTEALLAGLKRMRRE